MLNGHLSNKWRFIYFVHTAVDEKGEELYEPLGQDEPLGNRESRRGPGSDSTESTLSSGLDFNKSSSKDESGQGPVILYMFTF